MTINYTQLAATAQRLIEASGRTFTINKLAKTPTDANKPWRGNTDPRGTPDDTASVIGIVMDTISSRYLGVTIQREDGQQAEAMFLVVASQSAPTKDLKTFDEAIDSSDGSAYTIKSLNVLKPGDTEMFVAYKMTKKELWE